MGVVNVVVVDVDELTGSKLVSCDMHLPGSRSNDENILGKLSRQTTVGALVKPKDEISAEYEILPIVY